MVALSNPEKENWNALYFIGLIKGWVILIILSSFPKSDIVGSELKFIPSVDNWSIPIVAPEGWLSTLITILFNIWGESNVCLKIIPLLVLIIVTGDVSSLLILSILRILNSLLSFPNSSADQLLLFNVKLV